VFIRAEQPAAASLGVLLVVYGYFAYTFARYANSRAARLRHGPHRACLLNDRRPGQPQDLPLDNK
jgi:hypothetical protein